MLLRALVVEGLRMFLRRQVGLQERSLPNQREQAQVQLQRNRALHVHGRELLQMLLTRPTARF